jgi:DNA anti-recombination protein RmuC
MLRLSPTPCDERHVPVTAKLSKRFYDVLGEDVANELVDWFNAVDLTYRADLRELNELNFARFDAKLEQRLAELRAELREGLGELRAELREELAELRAEMREELAKLRAELKQEIAGLRAELNQEIPGLRAELKQEIAGSRSESRSGLHELRAELIKWMFGFWITTILTLAGLMVALHGA